jgi:beta-glucanase (GH16 family)
MLGERVARYTRLHYFQPLHQWLPRGAGLWPAVWSLGTNIGSTPWPACGEIDIMQHVGRQPRGAFGTIHGPGYAGQNGFTGTIELLEELALDFHVFAVEWTEGRIEWSLDDRVYHAATPADVPAG